MIVIGLTGSIGMGKSTVAGMFDRLGVPVHDSDKAVHDLIAGQARYAIAAEFPYYEYPNLYDRKTKMICRKALGRIVFHDDEKRIALENILHPLVRVSQNDFIRTHHRLGARIVLLDIPLLFETGADNHVDYVIAVTAPAHIQTSRVLNRPGMDKDKFRAILSRQIPDAEKCSRADFVIQTGLNHAHSLKQVRNVLSHIEQQKECTQA